jgi:putative flippase GtrA
MSDPENHVEASAPSDRTAPAPRPQATSGPGQAGRRSAVIHQFVVIRAIRVCVLLRLFHCLLRPVPPLANKFAASSTLRRYFQFGLVGGSGVVIDTAILFLLADPRALHLNLSLSKTVAAETAIINNFAWNDLWTFRDLSAAQAGARARLRRFLEFNLICLAGIVLNVLLLNLGVRLAHIDLYLANLIVILMISVWNFALNLRFAWRRPNPGTKAAAPCGSDKACASTARHAGGKVQPNLGGVNPAHQQNP